MTTFADMDEAVAYVETAIGEFVADYDTEAIASDVTEWVDGSLTLVAEDDEFWAAVESHDSRIRTKAELRALRETLGLTRQRLADDLGVKPLSVKRWELPSQPQNAPDMAWLYLDGLMEAQDEAVREVLAAHVDDDEVTLPYWANEVDYAMHASADDDLTWIEANALSRRIAIALRDRGVSVRWVDGMTAQ